MGSRTEDGSFELNDIEVLPGLTVVRRRPAMYIGDPAKPEALRAYVLGSLCWGLDEIASGDGSLLELRLMPDGSLTVSDDGAGMPVHTDSRHGKPICEIVMTVLTACKAVKKNPAAKSICDEGCGMAVVNALSARCELRIRRDGYLWQQDFEAGEVVQELRKLEPADSTGTTITLLPDPAIFASNRVTPAILGDIVARVSEEFTCGTIRVC